MIWLKLVPYALILAVIVASVLCALLWPTKGMRLDRRLSRARVPVKQMNWIVYAFVAFALAGTTLRWRGAAWLGDACLLIGALLALYGFFALRKRRIDYIRRQVLTRQYRVCSQCFYDLSGSPTSGQCPECGKEYTIAELKEKWSFLAPALRARNEGSVSGAMGKS